MDKIDNHKLRSATGQVLRSYRKRRKLTQEDASTLAGVSRSYISELEDGKHMPTLDSIYRLAGAYGVKPLTLMAHVDKAYLS